MEEYIFMDESWDLGFDFTKKKTSRYFVISFLVIKNPKQGNKLVESVIKGMSKAERKRHFGVLHFYQEIPARKIKLLRKLAELDIVIMNIYIDKKQLYIPFQNEERHTLYNYVTNILLDRIIGKKLVSAGHLRLIVARRETNKFLNENFQAFLKEKTHFAHNLNIHIQIEPYLKTPHKCLQLVDAIARTTFRKLERNDDSYYQYIKNKVVEEYKLFG